MWGRGGRWRGGGGGGARAFVLAVGAAEGDVTEGAAAGPVTAARFAIVAWLREVVVVVVTELRVCGLASWAGELFRFPC